MKAEYGEVHNCLKIGNAWVLTSLGGAGKQGAIGIYRCTSLACLDGQTEHGLAGWRFIHSPYGGGATVLAIRDATHTLVIDAGGHQLNFDVDTETFTPGN
jgi:hypothetical protein